MNTEEKIIEYLSMVPQEKPGILSQKIGVGLVMVHRVLKKLTQEGVVEKIGSAPKVYYRIQKHSIARISKEYNDLPDLVSNFYMITPDGQKQEGISAFVMWCEKRGFNVPEKAHEYEQEYKKYSTGNIINATQKIKASFPGNVQLDSLVYLQPYSIPVFGKTKLSQMLFHGKQTQNREILVEVFNYIKQDVITYISNNAIDAVAFIPPTLKREVQAMDVLKNVLNLTLPIIEIEKIKTPIMVQQKSLKDINDRILNAQNTMIIPKYYKDTQYQKILLIDDFAGSGATLNVLAGKIKSQHIAQECHGLAITGSMNGFDVIREI